MQYMDKFDGVAFVRITSAYPAGTLQRIQNENVGIYDVTAVDSFTIKFTTKRRDIRTIKQICEKRGDRVDVEGWTGWIFYIWGMLKRPVFLAGIFSWLFLALWLPTRILFVRVSGAETESAAYILERAADCGIRMGASGKEVRSERVKNALLSKIPSLRWAGVNTSGCIATISVREKITEDTSAPKPSVTDIISNQDAIIEEITVQSGTALCQPGQAVKKGQALISCYRDNGQILEFTGALGEVYGQTKHHLRTVTPLQAYRRTEIVSESRNFYVIIGKNPINFQKDSGILDDSCVKMYEVRECILPGGFSLPILLVTEYVKEYAIEPITLTDADCDWLADYAHQYLANDLIAGSVLNSQTTTEQTEELYAVLGTYDCREMIADYEYKGTKEDNGENS